MGVIFTKGDFSWEAGGTFSKNSFKPTQGIYTVKENHIGLGV